MRIVLLLGAGLGPDGSSPALRDRAEHAAHLYHAGRTDLILASGGKPRAGLTEAGAARRLLMDRSVPEQAILLEERAEDTWQNIGFSLPLLRTVPAREVILVTDALHMPRALLAARRHGLAARGSAVAVLPHRRRARARFAELRGYLYYALRRPPKAQE